MRGVVQLVLLTALASGTVAATDLTPIVKNQELGVAIKAVSLPVTLPKDLVSGLTNTVLFRVALLSRSQVVDEKTAEIAVKYDLWSETFAVTVTVNGKVASVRTYSTVQEIEALLAAPKFPDLFAGSEVPRNEAVTLRVEILLNPIQRERIEAIKRWVEKNSTYTPADTPGYGDKRVGGSRSNAIFNRIFEEYAHGTDMAAIWKDAATSKPFKIEEVGDDR
jgi:hypothetical protein